MFPGVEITANDGTHLLALFDPGCKQEHVDEFLSKLEIGVDQRGTHDARSPFSVERLLDLDCERGVIILGAHVNGPHGLLEHLGQQRINELIHPKLAAAEIDPARNIDRTWLDGGRPEIARVIPGIWCSDGHAFEEIGRRFTWIKMTRPNAEGLRLALLDGAGSLQAATQSSPGDPNRHAAYVIEEITVQTAKYMGRLSPLAVRFNPWFNAVIGGRGTGKSTIVDLCRLALSRRSELSENGDASLREVFDKRMRVPASRTEEGLLTADTAVEVAYRKDGERFVLTWRQDDRTARVARVTDEGHIIEEGDIRARFPVRIYSQKQLFDLAKRPNALLTVIDDTEEVRGAEIERARTEAETKYLSLCAEARSLRSQAVDLPTRKTMLADVRRKIEVLQQGDHSKVLNEYRLRGRQDATWASIQKSAHEGVEAIARAAEALVPGDLNGQEKTESDAALAALRRAHMELTAALQELRDSVRMAVIKARSVISASSSRVEAVVWREAVTASEAQFNTVVAQLAQAGIANPEEYRDLLQRAATEEEEILRLEGLHEAAAERDKTAVQLLADYRAQRGELTRRRQVFAARSSGELIRVEVSGYAEQGEVGSFVRETLGIERFDEDYSAIARRVGSSATAEWTFNSLDGVVSELRSLLADPQRPWPARDHRFEGALRRLQPERLDRLALYCPEDAVDVSFRDPRDTTGEWKKLSQGSPGQQTAALIAFVLGYGLEPIILDQPEDDLDNTLIYELLVRRIRDSKLKRQIIVVTHNANIVVHGDAELVVSLEARSGQTRIAFSGGLQEDKARDEICRVMEGGREAFESRYQRIMRSGFGKRG